MIFAAGVGSRLGSLTADTPKCLIEAGGKTMLEHVIDRLKLAGVSELVINLHHHPQKILAYLKQHGNFGCSIDFSLEPVLLDTGGGLKKAANIFAGQESFFIYNSDVYCDLDLRELQKTHTSSKRLATLVVMDRQESTYLLFGGKQQLIGIQKRDGPPNIVQGTSADARKLAFCGIQIVSKEIFQLMPRAKEVFSIIESYLEAARHGESVEAFQLINDYWIDMGSPEKLKELRARLDLKK